MKEEKTPLKLVSKKPAKFSAQEILDNVPDLDEMDRDSLVAYRKELEEAISKLDAVEPRNENSEAYETWAEEHEDLEDILDEVLDLLESM